MLDNIVRVDLMSWMIAVYMLVKLWTDEKLHSLFKCEQSKLIEFTQKSRHYASNSNYIFAFNAVYILCAEQCIWPASIEYTFHCRHFLYISMMHFAMRPLYTSRAPGTLKVRVYTYSISYVYNERKWKSYWLCHFTYKARSKVLLLMDSIWALARTYHSSL